MRFTWHDGAATVLVVAAAVVTLSVASGWNWPLLADARAGGIAVLALGFSASVLGGGPTWFMAALRRGAISSEGRLFSLVASVAGLAALALLVANLFVNSLALLVWATVALVAIWVIATIHHAVETRPRVTVWGL